MPGSVVPARLITGIDSDLRITAQVSQNVYDTTAGHHRRLIPRGTKLLGRYDGKMSFGQSRVLVVCSDIIIANGSTLQIGGMAGTDAEGYGCFNDKVNNDYFRNYGSAIIYRAGRNWHRHAGAGELDAGVTGYGIPYGKA